MKTKVLIVISLLLSGCAAPSAYRTEGSRLIGDWECRENCRVVVTTGEGTGMSLSGNDRGVLTWPGSEETIDINWHEDGSYLMIDYHALGISFAYVLDGDRLTLTD
ncbi:MAG: hypothetical protein IKD69_06130, partial [Solobacterium sp.]|nr:hypothetical protein [Solobacterium sp.]